MPNVNFYLKKPNGQLATSLIFLQFKFNGQRLVYSFGQKVEPKNWNPRTQRVKGNKATTADGQYALNDLLDTLSKTLLKAYNAQISTGIPSVESLKLSLDQLLFQNAPDNKPTFLKLLDTFINDEIRNDGVGKSKNTLQNYSTVKGHLIKFQGETKYAVSFDSINKDFLNKYVQFLERIPVSKSQTGLKKNTIAKDIAIIKTVMGEAVELGYTTNEQFRRKTFSVKEERTDSVYLSDKELMQLWKYDFSNDKGLEQVRDLFLVGAYSGMRYSDYSNLKPENIVEKDGKHFFKVLTQKTKETIIVPLNPVLLAIMRKYETNFNKLPKSISAQKFNERIKKVAKIVGLTEKGRLSTNMELELWQTISSHCARRSAITNWYLEGFPAEELMLLSGHRTYQAFKIYLKISKEQSANRLYEHIQRTWSSKTVSIAI